ncbi:MAG: MBL fold metallo-hydrolase [Proteobacteria bacterium]|nr:MBL fold metallo-hydrolase [Pseudomonadota bacterium]
MKVLEDLFFYPWEDYSQNNCNTIMITGPVKVLIDPGHKRPFPGLVRQLEADGIRAEEIDLVIHTHCHPDHMEAGAELTRLGAKEAMHPDDERYLDEMGPMFFQAMGLPMPEYQIAVHLVEGDLTLGDKTLQVYHTPGHSPGEVCLYWPEPKVLICGDLIFAQGVGRTDFPGGNGKQLKESIRRMAELDIELLLPGHGPAVAGRENVVRNFQLIEHMYFPIL